MNYSELEGNKNYLEDGFLKDNLVIILKDTDDGSLSISSRLNHDLGACVCCSPVRCCEEDLEVVKIYDGFTLEVLFEGE